MLKSSLHGYWLALVVAWAVVVSATIASQGMASVARRRIRRVTSRPLIAILFNSVVQEAAQYLPKVVQGKCPFHFLHSNGAVCSNTPLSNTSALTNSLFFRQILRAKLLDHLVWSNTSRFQFWGPLARMNVLSPLCGLPNGDAPPSCITKLSQKYATWMV